jgi:xanthine dehydrogenase YagR molybdenum-binding subunit
VKRVIKTQSEFEGRLYEEYVVVEGDELSAWPQGEPLTTVGKAQPRIDGIQRVTGQARYTYDVQLPGMLYGAILRSPHAHARLLRIDTKRAEALPGVRLILTHENTPEIPWRNGQTRLFDTTLRYAGEEVACVIADDLDIAQDALELIAAEYEVHPFVIHPEAALEANAPRLHAEGNIVEGKPQVYQRGDVEAGLKRAEIIVERTFRTQTALHNCLETHGSVALWEGETLTVWDSTQHIFGVRQGLATALRLPLDKVRVIKHYMGGGFGSKNGAGKYAVLAALAAKQLSRPVKIMLSRKEENLAAGNRHATIQQLRLGAKRNGTLTAIQLKSFAVGGAYGFATSVGGPVRSLYRCANVKTEECGVRVNAGTNAAFRAPGYVEGTFALESLLEELAEKLGLDPLDLRLANYSEGDQILEKPYSSKGLRAAYGRGAELIKWRERAQRKRATSRNSSVRCGFGMASQIWGGGGGPPAYALVKLNPDGTAVVISGTQDLGTGTKTVLAQIAAEELGLPLQAIRVEIGDTDGPYAPLSAGSMTVASVGPAVRVAAHDAKRQLLEVAAQVLETKPEQLKIEDGQLVNARGGHRVPLSEVLAAKLGQFSIIGRGERGSNPEDRRVNTFGAQFAEVEVDIGTGEIRVLRLVAVHESGRVINPLTIGSQIEGGVIQGLGFALMEGRVIDRQRGTVLNANLEDYKLPTMLDILDITHEMIDQADPYANNLGAKGVGEPPIVPTAAAIANAVYNAIGVRIAELPITRAKILNALGQRKEN